MGYQDGGSRPAWLGDWIDTGRVITADHSPHGTAAFKLYRKEFEPGPNELHPCAGDAGVMYVVLMDG